MQKPERLLQIPPAEIENTVHEPLQHIPERLEPQIIRFAPDVDETHIVIAVRRSESPRPAAGFHGGDDPHLLLRLDVAQPLLNVLNHVSDIPN